MVKNGSSAAVFRPDHHEPFIVRPRQRHSQGWLHGACLGFGRWGIQLLRVPRGVAHLPRASHESKRQEGIAEPLGARALVGGRFSCDHLAEDPQGGDLGPVLRRQRRSRGRTSLLPTTHRQHSHENRRSHDHRKWTNERGQVTWGRTPGGNTILEEVCGAGRPSSAAARASTGVLCPTSDFSKTGDLT